MSLTDSQIQDLAKRMSIPLADVVFKDELDTPLEFNKAYIINIQDSMDEQGNQNDGTHWTYLQCNKYNNGKMESIYFDPYGAPPPEAVKAAITSKTKAIVPVHLFGQSCDMEPIMKLAKKHNLYVIEDNAQAIGADYTFSDGRVIKGNWKEGK